MKSNKLRDINKIELLMSGQGYLTASDLHGVVRFYFSAPRGVPPTVGEIGGDTALLESAWRDGHAFLAAFGSEIRIVFTTFDRPSNALGFRAAPIFDALAACVKLAG